MVASWDVFCRVVDNFGDAAVCWRLARGLAAPGTSVRLWIDQPDVLRTLDARGQPGEAVEGVSIYEWRASTRFPPPAEVAVDAFGAGLPEAYTMALAAKPRSLWIVLEYLSAEPWVAAHHGLPSPHPSLPVERFFFFPGFGAATGGLLRERDFDRRREALLAAGPGAWWRGTGFEPPPDDAQVVSLFGYGDVRVAPLLEAWSRGRRPVVAAITQSPIAAPVGEFFGIEAGPGTAVQLGALEARFLPFVTQGRYDELLWSCDWNFVRGEDSFVRAQWAERPMVWQPYVQPDGAHIVKLDAFLERYCEGLESDLAGSLARFMRGWNGVGDPAREWAPLAQASERLRRHAHDWAARIAAPGDLAMNLARFCAERLE
jgi:uncharacterized repeat protein (TIGR03837 family)